MKYMEDRVCANVGSNIKKIRVQRGISQIKLAKCVGISQTHMSNIENGHTGISLWTAVKISRVLECSIDQIVDDMQSKNDKNKANNVIIDFEMLIDALKLIALKNTLY